LGVWLNSLQGSALAHIAVHTQSHVRITLGHLHLHVTLLTYNDRCLQGVGLEDQGMAEEEVVQVVSSTSLPTQSNKTRHTQCQWVQEGPQPSNPTGMAPTARTQRLGHPPLTP
jgi:hypothetical protein